MMRYSDYRWEDSILQDITLFAKLYEYLTLDFNCLISSGSRIQLLIRIDFFA
jgi:hypothetical protein